MGAQAQITRVLRPSRSPIHIDTPAPESHPRAIGGQYRIEAQLGVGGMSIIYRGVQLATDRPVAIKMLRSDLASIPEVVARFENEARVTARLRSDHVVAVLDAGTLEDGTHFIVYEYLDGEDLRRLLNERPVLPIPEAVDYVLQACEALADAHSFGIIHRDIKPENLVLTHATDGTALLKVLDFGVAKFNPRDGRSITSPGDALGSPQYMSPEQLVDPSSADARSDIWALGVVLYELLTGESPFDGPSVPVVSAAILTDRAKAPSELRSDVPRALDAIVLRTLQKKPTGRFADVGELARALAPFGPPRSETAAARVERILEYTSRRVSQLPTAPGLVEDPPTRPAVARNPGSSRRASFLVAAAFCSGGILGAAATFHIRPTWVADALHAKLRPTVDVPIARVEDFAPTIARISFGSAVSEVESQPVQVPPPRRAHTIATPVLDDPYTAIATATTHTDDASPASDAPADAAPHRTAPAVVTPSGGFGPAASGGD